MPLKIDTQGSDVVTVALAGRLDTNTAADLDHELDRLLATDPQRLVFEVSKLEYLSSAGIRCFVRARKSLEPRGGKVAVINPQPAVRKVLEIVKAMPPGGIFASVTELDAYLDDIQAQVRNRP